MQQEPTSGSAAKTKGRQGRHRGGVAQVVASLPAARDAATPDQVKQLITMVVEEVTTKDRVVDGIRLRPEAMPFFASQDPVLALAPPDGLEPPTQGLGRPRSVH